MRKDSVVSLEWTPKNGIWEQVSRKSAAVYDGQILKFHLVRRIRIT